ncbi:unnamed protein product [Peronospora destructor]|uniref:Uncharacterized protein n=1 Tax=Peronospora destructor TaxID=86335 RepID=A0AAV0VDF1_9STRA|nr:unnamed protein product [Peronospora destructor]
MSIKSSAYSKALVVAPLVSSTTSVTRVETIPEGVVRKSGAAPALDATYIPVSIEPYSRSSVEMTGSDDDTKIFGEKQNRLRTVTILEQRLQCIGPELEEELPRLPRDLNSDSIIADLLERFQQTK